MADFAFNQLQALQTDRMIETVRKIIPVNQKATTEIFTGRWGQWESVAKWDEIEFTREYAPLAAHAAPATNVDLLPRVPRSAAPAKIFLRKTLDHDTLTRLRRLGTTNEQGAQEIIADELRDLRSYIDYTVEFACWQCLTGTYTVDQTTRAATTRFEPFTGGVSPVRFSITYPVTALAGGVWATNSTDILTTELDVIRDKALDVFGMPITEGYCLNSIINDLYSNTTLATYWVSDMFRDKMRELAAEGTVPLREFNFHPYDQGYKPSGGSFTRFIADNKIIWLPPDAAWRRQNLGIIELSAKIPNKDRSGLTEVSPGIFTYADVEVNPPGVTLYMGYYFLPVIKWPAGVIYETVT